MVPLDREVEDSGRQARRIRISWLQPQTISAIDRLLHAVATKSGLNRISRVMLKPNHEKTLEIFVEVYREIDGKRSSRKRDSEN